MNTVTISKIGCEQRPKYLERNWLRLLPEAEETQDGIQRTPYQFVLPCRQGMSDLFAPVSPQQTRSCAVTED